MTATVRQSEFVAKHGLAMPEMKELRTKLLVEGTDWEKRGLPIYLTDHAVAVLESALSSEKPNPEAPSVVRVKVTKLARNSRFVYADLDGLQIAVNAGKQAKNILRKSVLVKVTDTNGEKTYSYHSK